MAKIPTKTGNKRARSSRRSSNDEQLPLGLTSNEAIPAVRKGRTSKPSRMDETPEESLEDVMPVSGPTTSQEAIYQEMKIRPEELPQDVGDEFVPPVSVQDKANALNIKTLQSKGMHELNEMARDLGIENFGTLKKHELIFQILQRNARRNGIMFSEGVLEVLPDGFGFLRSQTFNYLCIPFTNSAFQFTNR